MGVSCCRRGTMACRCAACPGLRQPTLVLPPLGVDVSSPPPKKTHSKMKVLKTIKKKMGLASRGCGGGVSMGNAISVGGVPSNNAPPLTFHSTHGDNVRISRDGTTARRVESFCKGVAFSARPVAHNEKVCLRFAEISNNWSGVIRFGFTTNDPSTLDHSLPKYVCPDLTNKPGYWAKALNERFCEKDNILHYFVTPSGDVHFGINGEDKGVFFSGVETRSPLWCLVDVYGNCTAIQFLDPRSQLNNQLTRRPNPQNVVSCDSRRSMSPETVEDRLAANMRVLSVDDPAPPLRYQQRGLWQPMPLHQVKGRNVRLLSERGVAMRNDTEFCQGYVFTARPLLPGEKLVVQVLSTEPMYVGSLALGLTSCDPAGLRAPDLPDDADLLLDRPEYWVVSKDAAGGPRRWDELGFCVTPSGEVRVSKNGAPPATVMHVDHTLRLWAFVDVYGSTQKVRIMSCLPAAAAPPSPQTRQSTESALSSAGSLHAPVAMSTPRGPPLVSLAGGEGLVQLQPAANGGTVLVVNLPPPQQQNQANHQQHAATAHFAEQIPPPATFAVQAPGQSVTNTHNAQMWSQVSQQPQLVVPGPSSSQMNVGADCTICYEQPIDSVLYMCGHMCMCYRCAVQQWKGKGGGQCPLCRAHIRDVIRTYKS